MHQSIHSSSVVSTNKCKDINETQNMIGESIDAIADALQLSQNQLHGFGYSSGLLGKVLFFYYYSEYTANSSYAQWAENLLTKAIRKVSKPYQGRNYYKEVSELGIFIEYMSANNLLQTDTDKLLTPLDPVQIVGMEAALKQNNFDPSNGALAAGLYFLARSQSSSQAHVYLYQLTEALLAMGHTNEKRHLFWKSQLFGTENIYLGISHGLALIILFLCRMYKLSILPDKCKHAIHHTVMYILSQERDYRKEGYFFPNIVGEAAKTTRLGLCYGDMGVGYSLYQASVILQDDSLQKKAIEIFDFSAERIDPEQSLVRDAGILYGASGVALLFDRMFDLTQRSLYKQAASYWYQSIPSYSVTTNATAGYQGVFNQAFDHTNIAFMEGIAGIGCTLIKYTDRDNYCFDDLIWLI